MVRNDVSKVKRFIQFLAVGLVAAMPLLVARPAYAASATMYLSPASSSVTQGSILTVGIREDSGGDQVNAAQANLSYPADKLDFVSVVNSPAFSIVAETSGGGGSVRIGRGALPAVSGDKLIASVRFKAKTNTGTAAVSIASGSQVKANDGKGTNILTATRGGNYTLKPPAPEAPKDTAAPTIANISATDIKINSVTITWQTSEPANSQVEYGVNTSYGLAASDSNLVTEHKVTLSSALIMPATEYHYIVKSTDAAGNTVASPDQTFSTKGAVLAVKVVNQNNKPVKDAKVTIGEKSGTTDKNGQVALANLPLGKLAVTIDYKGQRTAASTEIKTIDPTGAPQAVTFKIRTPSDNLIWIALAILLVLLAAAGALFMRRRNRNKGQGPPTIPPVGSTSSGPVIGPGLSSSSGSYKPPPSSPAVIHPSKAEEKTPAKAPAPESVVSPITTNIPVSSEEQKIKV